MNLAVVGRRLSGIGSGAHLAHLELAGFLEDRGHTVRYAARKGEAVTRQGKPIEIRRKYVSIRDASAWADWTLVRDEPKTMRILRRTDGRVLYCCHSPAGAPPELGITLRPDSRIVYVSQALRDAIEAKHGPQLGIVIEGCPMDLSRYRTEPGECVTLINLSERKGGKLFWRLAEAMPDIPFLGVKLWGEQIVPDRIPPNVTLLDRQPDPKAIYSRTRILLIPSMEPGTVQSDSLPAWTEAWNRVGVEAAASGIPVIASPVAGIRASICDAAVYVSGHSTEAWAAAIRRFDDPDHVAAMSFAALIRAGYIEAGLDRILDAYEELLRGD
jgi:glycosyltransferase involved in cell wall biosynthesis